ncbi:MAG: FAD-binding protein [Sulfurimonas sp.]|nr:FAD-binding protein [Sulfurimonas sp.]
MAQGGINAALGNAGEDSVASHIANTLKSAKNIASLDAIKHLCENAPDAIAWLDSIGVCFSRTKDSKIAQRALGGASSPRACYAQDYTGLKILHTLYDRCLEQGIEIIHETFLLDIHTHENTVMGVSALDIRSGETKTYEAASVILATGGYSRVYNKHSTNSTASTGDGIASALRAGASLSDMEFVQFHPTGLKHSSILISESARGAGGYLVNSKGERFIDELLPRDTVARAIDAQIKSGENVFLDIRHLDEEFINRELPQERKLAKLYENVDPVSDLVPIKPVAHYTMGGIDVDAKAMTSVRGLFATGECANHSVHGANRLGGNSLLELIVFGKLAGENAAEFSKNVSSSQAQYGSEKSQRASSHALLGNSEIDFYKIREELGDLFYSQVGIIREASQLADALVKVESHIANLPQMGVKDTSKVYNTNKIEFLEFKNILELSRLILLSALSRNESRGAHFRSDKPDTDASFDKHTVIDKDGVVS